MPITRQMRVLTVGRLGLVLAVSCAVLGGCGSNPPAMFPLPELNARQSGNVVTVSYHLPENGQPRPKWILVKVSESGGIPVGGNYPVHGNSGQVQIDHGNSGQVQIEGPFEGDHLVALAQTIDLEGHSEVARAPVRPGPSR